MKSIIRVVAVFLALAVGAVAVQAQGRILKEISAIKGVESVYVGKFMLRTFDSVSTIGVDYEFGEIVGCLDGIEIVSAETEEAVAKALPILENLIKKHTPKFEVLVETVDEDETTVIYGDISADKVKCLLIVNREMMDELSIIALRGDIPVEKLASITD